MRKAIVIAFIFLVATVWVFPRNVAFKLTGGLAWINGDDYNRGIAGENTFIRDTTVTMSGAYKTLKSGMNFQLEILTYLGADMGIGFGGGYYRLAHESRVTSSGLQAGVPFNSESTYKPYVSVIPFFVNLHYMKRLASHLNIDIFAGPLFQIAQFSFENPSKTSLLSMDQTVTFTASSTSLGFQGGFGLNYEISAAIALIAEGCYRYGKISDLQGNWAAIGSSASGPINNSSSEYYFWLYDYTLGGTYTRIGFFDNSGPAGNSVTGARKAALDLSGLTVSAGIKFSF